MSELVENVAEAEELSISEARMLLPSKKVTVPVGFGTLLTVPATAALNRIDWPVIAGFAEEVRVVMVAASGGALTTSVRTDEVEAA